ncbi:MAG: hypothetical protein KAJ54_02295 [Candidatus Aenigmarchaeota archaeon]|nr:hypothetical protein [Candidatus Aenigmarchaeota archaeon]MCK5322394.1 hypothetical protein [Candidatus Aenigmarchaeota archaeon]
MSLIVKSKIRDIAKDEGMNVSQDADRAFEKEMEQIVRKAIYRAKENGRSTIKGRDI